MQLSPLQMIIILVILAGFVIGTYSATMDQLPDLTGTVVGNTTNHANNTNNTIGTFYLHDENNNQYNTSIIVKNNTKIFKETEDNKQVRTDFGSIKNGGKIDVYTVGDPTNTIPPQVIAEKIVLKK